MEIIGFRLDPSEIPIFLVGPPGIGKPQIMEQSGERMPYWPGSIHVTHHTRQSAVGAADYFQEKEYGGKNGICNRVHDE